MGIFSKSKEKDELILVFNIGSSFVGGAFFHAQKFGVPKIIFSVEEPIRLEEKVDIDRLLFQTIQALEIVVNKVYMAGMGAPSRIFCILSSPWYVSQIRIISLKKNTSFLFTTKLADNLIQKEVNLFKEQHVDSSFRIIEMKNIKTTLNGYDTSSPLNKKVKELEMVVFVSMGGEEVLTKIENTIGKCFHSDLIKFSSFALASFAVVRDIHAQQENFLLIDVGGEITDIFMAKKSALRESATFPYGRNFFIRGIASSLRSTFSEASSLFSLFKDGHAEKSVVRKLIPIINQLKAKWLKQLEESLAHISNDVSIPSTIYLATDKENADFFSKIIEIEQFSQYSLTESKFKIILLNTQTLHGVTIFEEGVNREPFLIINSIYINHFLINSAMAGRV